MRKGFSIKTIPLLLVSMIAILSSDAQANGGKRVLLIAREKSEDLGFMLKNEVLPMIAQLAKAGYDVVVADESGSLLSSVDQLLKVDWKLVDARIDGFAGILVPCMAAPYNVPTEAVRLLKEGAAGGVPIAAQHSLELLSPAGLLKDRRYAFGPGVIRDGLLITSYNCPMTAMSNRNPEDGEGLIAQFIAAMEGR